MQFFAQLQQDLIKPLDMQASTSGACPKPG